MQILPRDPNHTPVHIVNLAGATIETVDGTSGTAQSAAVASTTDAGKNAMITFTASGYMDWGTNPTATSADMPVWAEERLMVFVPNGMKLAFLSTKATIVWF